MLYHFQIEKWKESSKVSNRKGESIAFVDMRNFSPEEVYEKMHEAYGKGLVDGRRDRNLEIRKILGV